ncbi:alpha/beta fold hydrolase [Paenarthrobacter sp. NCHU4564]|uniref:alpha/beta fold hydrolase n=1 Tax=Paenarthrobacter sp. NCHU4564 TaxID=3451353 RepID=UPI003F991EAA
MTGAYFQQGRDTAISYPVTVGDITTRVVESGSGDRVLVCIHGVGSRADRFVPAMPALAASGFRIIAVDLPGHGLASKPEDFGYRPRDFARFLEGVLEALDLRGVTVLGTSLGGQVGATLACNRPDLVADLVLIGTMGIVPMDTDSMVPPEKVSDGSPEAVRAKLTFLVSSPDQIVDAWVREESQINSSAGARQALHKAAQALNEDSVADLQTERLLDVRPDLNVLLVWGEKDSWTPLSMGYRSRDALPEAELRVMQDCGHAPYFENPAEFAAIIEAFWNSQPARKARGQVALGGN